jgi:hypothetical protein
VTLAQRFDRAISAAAVLLVLMTVATTVYWVKKRPDANTRGSLVVGKHVVINETGRNAHVDYILTLDNGARSEVLVPAEIYQRAAVGARVERRGGGWIVTPR